jgi:hypothetical protein
MSERRASISGGRSYEEIGEYWDTHDAGDVVTGPVDFEADLKAERFYYPIERSLSDKVIQIAHERGVSAETLVNLWIQEKVSEP